MEVMPGDDAKTPIWDTYRKIVRKYEERGDKVIRNVERFAFYEEARKAYAIVATGEGAVYALSLIHISRQRNGTQSSLRR